MKDKLLQSSRTAAHRAIRCHLAEEYDDFFIEGALCFERLGKARLATIHPSLIVGGRDDVAFHSLLAVCSKGNSIIPLWRIRTITAVEVLKRCTHLDPRLSEFSEQLGLLAEYRNSAIHLGEVVDEKRGEIFHAFIASTTLLIDAIGLTREQFYGEYSELVSTHLNKSLAEVYRLVADRIAGAKSTYESKYGSLDEEHRHFVIDSIQTNYSPTGYEEQLNECPACGNQGMLSGTTEVDWDVDVDDDGMAVRGSPTVSLTFSSFVCNVCKLKLEGAEEMRAANLGETIYLEDVSLSDLYASEDYP